MAKPLGLPQFLIIIFVSLVFILSWDFGRRILETVQLVQAVRAANQQLTQDQTENQQLMALKKRVTTDDWAMKEARVNLRYAKETETLLIPVSMPAASAAPTAVAAPPTPERPFWQDWLEALFGPTQSP